MFRAFCFLFVLCSFQAHAGKALFSIVPVAGFPYQMSIPANTTAQVRYTVTNNVKQAQTIVLKPEAHLIQQFGSGFCGATTRLNPGQSCTMVVNVSGKGEVGMLRGGPVVCQALNGTTNPNLYFCSEPSLENTLEVTFTSNIFDLLVKVTNLPNVSGATVSVKNGTIAATYTASGTYTLNSKQVVGTPYKVAVTSATNAVCTVENGVGTINNSNVTVNVVCASSSYQIGGVISGLVGNISLLNNSQYSVSTSANGSYAFPPVANGATYNVTVASKPANQTCSVTNPSGTVSRANVAAFSNVNVYCASTTYSLGGTISGLPTGEAVVLSSGVQSTTFSTNGNFRFPSSYAGGTQYNVTVAQHPASAFCEVSNGGGTLSGNVSNVSVTCYPTNYTYGGQVYNFDNGSFEVTTTINDVSSTQTISNNGSTMFGKIFNGANYSVAITSQPPNQTCQIVNSSGTVAGASVSNIDIYCTESANLKRLGGYYSVNIQPNQAFSLMFSSGISNITYETTASYSNASVVYRFGGHVANGDIVPGIPYNINIVSPHQNDARYYCMLTNASGSMPNQHVTNADIYCGEKPGNLITGSLQGLPSGESVVLTTGQTSFTETLSQNINNFTLSSLFVPTSGYWQLKVAKQPATAYCVISPDAGGPQTTAVQVSILCIPASVLTVDNNVVIPVGSGQKGSITIYNPGPAAVSNVKANIPSGWLGLTQDSSRCSSLAVGASCSIDFSSSKPYPPIGNITLSGTNVGSSNAINIAFSVGGNLVYNARGNAANVVLQVNDTTPVPMYTTNMPAPTTAFATSDNDSASNTNNWISNYNNFPGQGLPYHTCAGLGGYLPAACQFGPPGSSANTGLCQGSGIYNLIQLGFITVDTNHSFWTSTQSSTSLTSVYAVKPSQSLGMSLQNGTTSNYVICVKDE